MSLEEKKKKLEDLISFLGQKTAKRKTPIRKDHKANLGQTNNENTIKSLSPNTLQSERNSMFLSQTTIVREKYKRDKNNNDHGLGQTIGVDVMSVLSQIDKRIWIKSINVERNVIRRGSKKYVYLRKRVDLPRDFNDSVAVVMTRRDFVELLKIIASLLGLEINKEEVEKLFSE